MMAQHGGKRTGAGRPKGSKNKMTIAKDAIAEILDIDDAQMLEAAIHKRGHTLLTEMERIATDPTQPVGARIMAAKVALPFLARRRENFQLEGDAGNIHFQKSRLYKAHKRLLSNWRALWRVRNEYR